MSSSCRRSSTPSPVESRSSPPPNYTRIREALPDYDGWFSYPKADPRELPFGIGLAILSRTPLIEKARIDVPSPAIEFEFMGRKTTPTDRLMIGAKTVVEGREVQFYNVHLLAFFMLGSSSTLFPGSGTLSPTASRSRTSRRSWAATST